MSCTICGTWPCGCPDPSCLPARSVLVPSPEPPWKRANFTPLSETLTFAGPISLTANPTFLEQTLNSPAAPVAMVLPNGSAIGQYKTILIATNKRATTETFNVSGTFNGFTSLQFDSVGYVAVLMFDGTGWVLVGGNVTTL